ncbi:MAG: GntR family transcriptional regulator [Lachnospiraceae bacterium]|nr:GntR family transcriptional regulator [Lachnospiraceae bacterium]
MIPIDLMDSRPIYEQVTERFKMLILRGIIKADEKIPSVRNLAVDLSINPNTIQRAYAELEKQGYIYTVKGKGNFAVDAKKLLPVYREEIMTGLRELCERAEEIGITKEELICQMEEWRNS